MNGNYANGGAIATAINNQLGATASTVTAAYDGTSNTIKFTNSGANANTAVVISGADANSTNNLGIANSSGTAGGAVGAQFSVDGNAITLTSDLSASATVFANGIQSALNTAAPGTYTVELTGSNIVIRNNNAGSTAVNITGANDIAVAAGITNSTGSVANNPATAGSFVVENGVTDVTVNLNQNYADFDTLASAIETQLNAGPNTGVFSVTNDGGQISIARTAGGVVQINSANARATAAGFGPATGVITTNATFQVDGNAITLDQDYTDINDLATGNVNSLQAKLDAVASGAYTVSVDGSNLVITNNTAGSAAVAISGGDTNAQAAGFVDTTGTAGVGAGSVSVTNLTLLDGTGKTSSFSGTFASVQELANSINSNANGVFASATTDGKLQLQSALAFTVGGSDATGFGFSTSEVTTSNGSLNEVNVLTTSAADEAIVRIDSALQSVSSLRSDFGAVQNRFESTISNLQITSENLAASRSRILDADFAAETANLTRAQILQQAGVAILAQANQLPQNVLSLLR
nr:flagellin [Lysobacter sp. CAU 1642]